jgi:O-antigen/teichoic acid export membrane protein
MASTDRAGGRLRGLVTRYQGIIGQGSWVIAGQAATGILTLGGNRLITQFVNPELYGAVNLLQNSLVLLRTLFCSPTLNAGLRYYPEAERGHYVSSLRAHLRRSLGRSVVPMEILTIGGAILWCWTKGAPLDVVLGLALFVGADVSRTFEMSLFNAARRQRPAAILSAAETLVRPLLVVLGVLAFGPRIDVVMGALALSIGVTLVLLFAAFEPVGVGAPGKVLPPGVAPEMRRYAIPLIPIALMNWFTSVSDRYIIAWFSHNTFMVGVYAAGYGLVSQPFLLMHAVVALTLRPAYFSSVAGGNDVHARHVFRVWLFVSVMVCMAGVAAFYLGRTFAVDTFLGPRYRGAISFVPWIALGYLFYVVEQVLEQQLLAYKRTVAVLTAQTGGAIASVAVTIPCVLRFGAKGAAYACPIYFSIQCLIVAVLMWRSSRQVAAESRARL